MKSYIISAPVLVLLLFVSSCRHKSPSTTATLDTGFIPVKVIEVGSSTSQSDIYATGLVTTDNEAKYAFKTGGIIQSILVEEGQFFKKGQLLATLNITEISAGLDQASLNVEKAGRDYTRAANLYKDSVYSLEQMQDTKTKLDLAQKAKEGIAFNAQYARIYATSDGFVNKKIANVGEVIGAGSQVLAINETKGNGAYLLRVGIADKEWALVELGQQAKVVLDGFPGDTILATVFRKSQVADPTDGSFQIELKLDLHNIKPAIGMFGKARIATQHLTTSTPIPYDALVEADGDRAFVFAPTSDGKVQKVPIVIATFNNHEVYVKSGLENIKQIIVSNSAFLNEQSQIKVIK